MAFKMRTATPEKNNKYYTRSANGGYNPCILGNTQYIARPWAGAVIPNCVGYATGRFNEIGGYNSCKYLGNTNAENFYALAQKQGLKVGQIPKVGACMVWQAGPTLSGGDGAGHVVIVEKVVNNNEVVVSQSGWASKKAFWTATHKKGSNGQWVEGSDYYWMKSGYKFLGFIYNPATEDVILSYGSTGEAVRELQRQLNMYFNAELPTTGNFLEMTVAALKTAQTKLGVPATGYYDVATKEALDKHMIKPNANIKDVKVLMDGKEKTLWGTMIDGHWYIQLIDFDDKLGLATISYDAAKHLPVIKKK